MKFKFENKLGRFYSFHNPLDAEKFIKTHGGHWVPGSKMVRL